jgi:hypothetical protein
MLSSLLLKRGYCINSQLKDYCMNSTKKSIDRIVAEHNLDNFKIINQVDIKNYKQNLFVFIAIFLTFFSCTFYKRIQ